MSAKRAEARFREEKEKALNLQKELETLKARTTSGTMRRENSRWANASEFGDDNGIDIPQRKSSLRREMSMSKGFFISSGFSLGIGHWSGEKVYLYRREAFP